MAFAHPDAYQRFEREIKSQSRYVYSAETDEFIAEVIATARTRSHQLPAGSIFSRARIGHVWRTEGENDEINVVEPYPAEEMKPLRDLASENRANPKGIPRLYVASSLDTAVAEVRPWKSAFVSVSQFKTVRDCKLVDCSADKRDFVATFDNDLSPDAIENVVWGEIAYAFSKPVTANERSADYAPTQVLAEVFKKADFDGVAYKSLLGEGHNVAFYDLDIAEYINRFIYRVDDVTYKVDQTDNPYYVAKHYPEMLKTLGLDENSPAANREYMQRIVEFLPAKRD
jgi:hypothetical protein